MPDEYFQSSLTAQQIETVLTQNQTSVLYSAQSLTDTQKNVARNNIGAYSKPSTGIAVTDLSQQIIAGLYYQGVCNDPASKTDGISNVTISDAPQFTSGFHLRVVFKNGANSTITTIRIANTNYSISPDIETILKPGAIVDFVYRTFSYQAPYWLISNIYPNGIDGGASDYSDLTNKPSINGVTLTGNKTTSDLGLYSKPSAGIPKADLSSAVQISLETAGTAYQKPSDGIPKTDLVSAIQTSLGKADTAYQKPSTGIPKADLSSAVQISLETAGTAYQKPSDGIPKADLVSAVQTSLGKADTAYQKPSTGIPKSDMSNAVLASLGRADTAYQKSSDGIPKTDLVSAVQTSLGKADTAYQKPSTGIPKSDMSNAVLASLGRADTAYQKPDSGIPESDLASSVQATLIPSGGSAGQVLKKSSSTDYDVIWANDSGGSGGGGTSDYSDLTNKPSINGVTLAGNKTTSDLGLYSKPSTGIPKTDLASGVQTSLSNADTAYQKPSTGIPETDLASAVQTSLGKADTAYQKSSTGIPKTDLASGVQTSLGKADTAYQKSSTGIPKTDLASGVQTSLDNADTAYQKPDSGIPESDLSSSVQATLIPSGGSAGQVLKKNSSSDYDVYWANESGGSGGSGGTSDYSDLINKPSINGVTLTGNKTTSDLGLYSKPSTGIPETDLASAVQATLIPSGGSAGQVLKKKTATDHDVEWANESGGSSMMIVTATYNSQTYKYETDKTFAEIYEAYQNGTLICAKRSSDSSIYNLSSVSSSAIIFYSIIVNSTSIYRYYIQITSSNSVTCSYNYMETPSVPSPLHQNPILLVKYDDSVSPAKYVVYGNDGLEYMYEVFNTDGYDISQTNAIVTLQYSNSMLNMWGTLSNAEIEEYKLTDAYTTYQEDPDGVYEDDQGNYYSFYGHLVFSKIKVVNGQVKLKQFTVENNFQGYMDDTATVTYSEISLGQAPSANGVNF